jgi:hypothetical protein
MSNEEEAAAAHPHPGKPMLSGPKRQHFLPKFYLEGFAREGMVAVYDRETNEVRVQQPVNTGVIGHFYTMEDEQGRKRFELEQLLSEYEGKAKPAVDKLAARGSLNADERSDLSIFLALGAMRTPDVVDSLKLMNSGLIRKIAERLYSNEQSVFEQLRGEPENAGKSEEELRTEAKFMAEFIRGGGYEVTTKHQWAVGMAIQMALDIAPVMAGRDWTVLHRAAERKSFITTDAPVLLTTITPRENNFWGVGFANSDALVFFPLTQSCVLALFGSTGELAHRDIHDDRIRQINLAMAAKCRRFVLGRDATLVRSLAERVRLSHTEWKPKMEMR